MIYVAPSFIGMILLLWKIEGKDFFKQKDKNLF